MFTLATKVNGKWKTVDAHPILGHLKHPTNWQDELSCAIQYATKRGKRIVPEVDTNFKLHLVLK